MLYFHMTTLSFNLPPGLLESVCFVESSYNVNAIHHDDGKGDSLGVCQIKIGSARMMGFKGTSKQLMDPATNIYFAGKYLSHQLKRYNQNVTKSLISYNQGSAKTLTSTRYSRKVIKRQTEGHIMPPM